MEKINLKKVRCQAKVVGTLVTVGGAMVMTLYKGPLMEMVWHKHALHQSQNNNATTNASTTPSDRDWLIGSILLIIATLAWASLFVLQVRPLMLNQPKMLSCLIFHFYFINHFLFLLSPHL